MRHVTFLAIGSGLAVVTLAVLLGGGGAVALPGADPTPVPTGAAPITVIIPGSGTASPTPRPSSTLPTLPFEDPDVPGGSGACEPGAANADGSPVPAAAPRDDLRDLAFSEERPTAGGWVVASASGFQPAELGQVVLYPGAIVVGSYTVGADGEFSARFRVPTDTAPGSHVLEVTGWVSGCAANGELTVVSGASSANWLTLWWVYIVLGALLLGLLSLVIAFRADIARWFAPVAGGSPSV